MSAIRVVINAACIGCLTLVAAGGVSSATTEVKTQTFGPVKTAGWVSDVYGFPAKDICRLLFPRDHSPRRAVTAQGLSITYKTVSATPVQTQSTTGVESSVSATQTLTTAKAASARCR